MKYELDLHKAKILFYKRVFVISGKLVFTKRE